MRSTLTCSTVWQLRCTVHRHGAEGEQGAGDGEGGAEGGSGVEGVGGVVLVWLQVWRWCSGLFYCLCMSVWLSKLVA
jgi:hypothetical protein